MNEYSKSLFRGLAYGFGFSLVVFIFGSFTILVFKFVHYDELLVKFNQYIETFDTERQAPTEMINFEKENPSDLKSINYEVFFVDSEESFINALQTRDINGIEIVFKPGKYKFNSMINISRNNLILRSLSANPEDTIISGPGMFGPEMSIFRVTGSNISFRNLTIENASLHLIQIAGEENSSYINIEGCILRDARQQFVKISYDKEKPNNYSRFGSVKSSIFYFTQKIAPHFYTGGIDGHGVRHWVIENNIFKDIASPSEHVSEHAIHLWNNSAFNLIKLNTIINSDRGIGIGLGIPTHRNVVYGGYNDVVEDNIIYNNITNRIYSDVGIGLEGAEGTIVSRNLIFTGHDYPNAIEYRFKITNASIIGNITNKEIKKRNNGQAVTQDNIIVIDKSLYLRNIFERFEKFGMTEKYKGIVQEIEKDINHD